MVWLKGLTLAIALGIVSVFLPGAAWADLPKVTADTAVLLDVESGRIYYAKNHTKLCEPASLTKIMTAVVALENGNLKDLVTIGEESASVSMGSILDLREGEQIVLEELLKAALVCSANDSTVAIAEQVGGSHDRFVAMMNKKAAALGLFDTRFVNTNGYHDDDHYTTAYDLAVLTRYALGNPIFNELVQTKELTVKWTEPLEREQKITNTNRLLTGSYSGVDGVKTGTTSMAGNCLIASASKEGRRLIAVALHSDDRYKDCLNMLDYGFQVVCPVVVLAEGQVVTKAVVTDGITEQIEAVAEKELQVRLDPEELLNLEERICLTESLAAPLKRGQNIGEVVYTYQGQEIGRAPLVTGSAVLRKDWPQQAWDRLFIAR